MDKGQVLMQEISGVQSRLSRGEIIIDAPCGPEPIVDLLGGIHARASTNYTNKGRFPTAEKEFKLIKNLIALIKK